MTLDSQTRRNLELFQGGRWARESVSLYATLDFTKTPMGGRMLRHWLGQPLLELDELNRRLEAVAFFYTNLARRERARVSLSHIVDLERALTRVRLSTVHSRELLGLKASLEASAELVDLLADADASPISWLSSQLRSCPEVVDLIEMAIQPEAGGPPGEGNIIRPGFSSELDQVRSTTGDARQCIARMHFEGLREYSEPLFFCDWRETV